MKKILLSAVIVLLLCLITGSIVVMAADSASLIAHYDFNEINDGNIVDKVGSYNARLTGGNVTNGKLDKAVSLTGAAGAAKGSTVVSRLEIPANVFEGLTDWSISVLVKSEAVNLDTAFITWGNFNSQTGPFINIWFNHASNQNAGVHVAIQPKDKERLHGRSSADDYIKSDGNFHWFTVTQKGFVVKVYIDNKNVITMENVNVTAKDLVSTDENNNIIAIGSSVIFTDKSPICIVDDVRIYNGALTASQIQELVNLEATPATEPETVPETSPEATPETTDNPDNGNVKTGEENTIILFMSALLSSVSLVLIKRRSIKYSK